MVELLAPAGSRESLEAAVAAGADAVYMGGLRFGARAYAENPDDAGLLSAIDYVHLHGRKLYLTVNTLLKEKELSGELAEWLAPAYEEGLDAVLVQDLGVMETIRRHFPDMEVHISTQMAVGAPWGARLVKELGASRLVLPRELSLEEIRQIRQQTDIELEAFIHGALCYATSGQCLLSSLIGGRSGNRGRCAQPCRLPYNGSHLLNLKDLCTLDILPEIVDAGVTSLKIEGRMKGPRYTAGVVSVYRRALDELQEKGREGYAPRKEDRELLAMLYDRGGGFTEGYYRKHNGADMIFPGEKPALRKVDETRLQEIDRAFLSGCIQEKIEGRVRLVKGEPAVLEVSLPAARRRDIAAERPAAVRGEIRAAAEGPVVQAAKSRPVTREEIRERFQKTGGTPFVFVQLETEIPEDAFLPVGAMNALRREALEKLEAAAAAAFRREYHRPEIPQDSLYRMASSGTGNAAKPETGREVWASLENMALLPALLPVRGLTGIILPADRLKPGSWRKTVEKIHAAGHKASLALPFVFRKEASDYLARQKQEWQESCFDSCLVRNLDEAAWLMEQAAEDKMEILKNRIRENDKSGLHSGERVFDAGLYAWNREAAARLLQLGADILTLPVELRKEELLERGILPSDEMVIYGRLPLMISAQCTAKTTGNCRKGREENLFETPGFRTLTDRKRADFLEDSRCRFCHTVLYNCLPLWLLDRVPESLRRVRFAFTDEKPEEAVFLLQSFLEGHPLPPASYTRGHFGRGVE